MKILFFCICLLMFSTHAKAVDCVNIFYDQSEDSSYWMGKTYSIFLQNLLGHFSEFQQIVSPIEFYRKGDIEKCRATFYLGSYFENKIPSEFIDEFKSTKKSVVWLGYSVWKLGDSLEDLFGYKYDSLTKLDYQNLDEKGMPSFYKWIDYKGEVFFKFSDWSKSNKKEFLAPFEQVKLVKTKEQKSQVLAESRHSRTNEKIPYIIRTKNHFYVADIPFSFMHEADRYLVFADLLFDILQVQPRNEKLALVRIEDVHPLTPLYDLRNITNVLKKEKVPINISLIPIFYDPLAVHYRKPHEEYVTIDRKKEFLQYIQELKSENSSIIWHGVTHQYQKKMNPHNGSSGDDFEFWDAVNNSPVFEDSSSWVIRRLFDGLYTILKSGLDAPKVWLTPHYQASALDYLIFARVFPWNVGRVIYFDYATEGLLENKDSDLWLKQYSIDEQSRQITKWQNLKVNIRNTQWNGQFFPYEIYGDIYGQRILPENLGNSQPYISDHVIRTRTAEEIVRDARRNLVIRDAWASFFYHPYLLQKYESGGRGAYPGDPKELNYIVTEIKKLGYKFVSSDEFVSKNTKPIRLEPIYRRK